MEYCRTRAGVCSCSLFCLTTAIIRMTPFFGQKYPFPSFLSSVVRVWSKLCNLVRVCETLCDFVRICATLCVSMQPYTSASLFRPLTPPSTGIAIKIHLRVSVHFCATLCSFGCSAVFKRCSPQRLSYAYQQAIHILELILM